MKKVMLLAIPVIACVLFQGCSKSVKEIQDMKGWHLMGDDMSSYELGTDTAKYNNQQIFYIKSISNVKDTIGTAANNLNPFNYLGKRVRLSGYIKTNDLDKFVQMFMRVDGGPGAGFVGETLVFDDMQNRPIKGTTDWQKYEIVLDVPKETKSIIYGLHVIGNGQAWFSGMTFDIVGNDVPTTDLMKK